METTGEDISRRLKTKRLEPGRRQEHAVFAHLLRSTIAAKQGYREVLEFVVRHTIKPLLWPPTCRVEAFISPTTMYQGDSENIDPAPHFVTISH